MHYWVDSNCRECPQTGSSLYNPRHAGLCCCAWLSSIWNNNYHYLYWHYHLCCAAVGKPKHASISERLQPYRWSKRCVYPRNWSSYHRSSARDTSVQSVVHVLHHHFCHYNFAGGNYILERKCGHQTPLKIH